jgi:hypothetical protein
MKISIFWDLSPCIPLKAKRRFGAVLFATWFHAVFLLGLFIDHEDEVRSRHLN